MIAIIAVFFIAAAFVAFATFKAGRKQERGEQLENEKDKALQAEAVRHRLVRDADYAARVREKFGR